MLFLVVAQTVHKTAHQTIPVAAQAVHKTAH